MRPRADVERALSHFKEAIKGARYHGDTETEIALLQFIDILKWTMGDDSTPFSKIVMGPCDTVDRARRQ